MKTRVAVCIYRGRTYDIPEIWLIGYQQTHGGEFIDGVKWWAYQTELNERANGVSPDA